jgi:hypothetical protein
MIARYIRYNAAVIRDLLRRKWTMRSCSHQCQRGPTFRYGVDSSFAHFENVELATDVLQVRAHLATLTGSETVPVVVEKGERGGSSGPVVLWTNLKPKQEEPP